MAAFHCLAPELVHCIGQYCELKDMQSLRLTCKYLADQFESEILHTLSLNVYRTNIGRPLSKILFLARNPASTPSRAVRHLSLGSLSPKHDINIDTESFGMFEDTLVPYPPPPFSPRVLTAEEDMKKYLLNALISLKNVQSVTWKTATADEEWAHSIVLEALKSYKNLIKVDISLAHARISLPLHLFTTLQSVSIDEHSETADDSLNAETIINLSRLLAVIPANQLTSLAVHREWQGTRTTKALCIHDLFQFYPSKAPPLRLTHLELQNAFMKLDARIIPHLRHLTSLYVYNILEPCREPIVRGYRGIFSKLSAISDEVMHLQTRAGCTLDELWEAMSREGIYLLEIRLSNVVSGFLEYLGQYTGLKKLVISTGLFLTGADSDVVAKVFFAEPLERHQESLEELVINATYEGLWCFGEHNVASIRRLRALKVLTISISSSDLGKEEDVHDHGERRKDVVKLLLDTCALHLPALHHLILRPAILDSQGQIGGSSARSRSRSYAHFNLVQSRIVRRLSEYYAPNPPTHEGRRIDKGGLPIVSVWRGMFYPEWKDAERTWGYRITPEDRLLCERV
ncbi:hypothetical protein CPB84DRAFT_1733041 [Gymnopilus junonius]|uniref:F-box domain-containing protein n=1 Tax=Gymnopilus junonius TaxID=109634 RepID=A0A9P5NJN9_GYMJU|nr:hypothetical protein CPB84DRAFT_1733041 [Gymnopilus junonius]